MNTFALNIAGFSIKIEIDRDFGLSCLPAHYAPFAAGDCNAAEPLLTLTVQSGCVNTDRTWTHITTSVNDLGHVMLYDCGGDTYAVTLATAHNSDTGVMVMDHGFSHGVLTVSPGCTRTAFIIDSMLRILFSQAAARSGAFLLHASVIVSGSSAVLFMGRSGTGKSTHAALWLKTFSDCHLLNDDNPVVRFHPGTGVIAYGSPWSGKTPCYLNTSAPVAAFVRLRQAPANSYTALTDIDAFVAILPGVSVITRCRRLYDSICSTIIACAGACRVGELACLPDRDAARLCRRHTI